MPVVAEFSLQKNNPSIKLTVLIEFTISESQKSRHSSICDEFSSSLSSSSGHASVDEPDVNNRGWLMVYLRVIHPVFAVKICSYTEHDLMLRVASSDLTLTGVMMGSGDAISQLIVERKSWQNFDARRSLRFFAIGTLFTGPLMWKWFTFLENTFPGKKRFSTALKRMLIDQAIFSPISYSLFLGILATLQGQDYHGIKDKWRKEFWIVYTRNLEVWPAVQLANFYFIPLSYRIFVTKIVGIFWNTYLSWQTNRPEQS